MAVRPRIVFPSRNTPQNLILTDAATPTMIMACVVVDKQLFAETGRAQGCRGNRPNVARGELVGETIRIYGLELPSLVLTADSHHVG